MRDLAESDEVDELLLLDLDLDRAEAVAEKHGGGRRGAERADAPTGSRARSTDVDVLVNSASYRVNLHAMRACLEAGCHYLDLGGLYWMTGDQLELDDDFRARRPARPARDGREPGQDERDGRARRARARVGESASDPRAAPRDATSSRPTASAFPYALQTLLDELTLKPVVAARRRAARGRAADARQASRLRRTDRPRRDDLHAALRAAHVRGELRLPLGELPALALAGAARAAARSRGARRAEFVTKAAATAVPASPNTVAAHIVEAARGDGRACGSKPSRGPRRPGASAAASSRRPRRPPPPYACSRAGRSTRRGALPPERCVEPDELFPELERRGCEFKVEVTDGAKVP